MAVFPPVDQLSVVIYAALAGVIVLATRLRPSSAFVALIAAAPFDFSHALGATTITFDKVVLVAAIIGLALRRAPIAYPRAILLSILAIVIATLLTIVVAEYREPVIRETLKWVQYLLVFAVAATAWSLDPDRFRLRLATIVTVSLVCVLALAQLRIGSPSVILVANHVYPRIAGPIEGPNQLAAYLGLALPFLSIWTLERVTVGTLLAVAVTSAALVLTLSRAGLLCAAIGVGIVLAFAPQRNGRAPLAIAYGAGVIAAAALLAGLNPDILTRFLWFGETSEAGSVSTRSVLWRAAYTMWERHPALGVGAGNFELLLPSVGDVGVRTHANSWYLQSLAEGGLPLLFATCALVWASTATFRRSLQKPLCLAAFAASAGFAIHGFMDFLVFYPKVAIMWFALLGVSSQESRT
ncbi:MAG TPA: O-antigen ligase family protein [Candidatus Acidoferrales bacterium]|nr:O-antigen ligase family protein [Candidatus Acidoferrales bacterium]